MVGGRFRARSHYFHACERVPWLANQGARQSKDRIFSYGRYADILNEGLSPPNQTGSR